MRGKSKGDRVRRTDFCKIEWISQKTKETDVKRIKRTCLLKPKKSVVKGRKKIGTKIRMAARKKVAIDLGLSINTSKA